MVGKRLLIGRKKMAGSVRLEAHVRTKTLDVGGGDEDAIINDYTWELTANGCAVLCEDGESIGILRIKNDTLYLDESNEISHFHKVDEFSHFDWDSLADNASEQ